MAELQRTSSYGAATPTGLDLLVSAAESVEGSVSPELRSDSDYLSSPPSTLSALFEPHVPRNTSDTLAHDATPTCSLVLRPQSDLQGTIRLSPVKNNPKKRAQIARSCARCRTTHKRCDESRPCKRCVRAGLSDCEDAAPRGSSLKKESTLSMLESMPFQRKHTGLPPSSPSRPMRILRKPADSAATADMSPYNNALAWGEAGSSTDSILFHGSRGPSVVQARYTASLADEHSAGSYPFYFYPSNSECFR